MMNQPCLPNDDRAAVEVQAAPAGGADPVVAGAGVVLADRVDQAVLEVQGFRTDRGDLLAQRHLLLGVAPGMVVLGDPLVLAVLAVLGAVGASVLPRVLSRLNKWV